MASKKHNRPLCGRPKKSGGTCQNVAGMRTEHLGVGACWMHGGSTKAANEAGKRQLAEIEAGKAMVTYGAPVETDPISALRDELWRTVGHVEFLRMQVEALEVDALHGPVGGGKESIPEHKPHVWVKMYQDERRHLLDVTKTCIGIGIEEKWINLVKDQGAQIATVLHGVLADLGVLNKPETPEIVRRHLEKVAAGMRLAA